MPTVQRFFDQELPYDASRAREPTPLSNYIDKRVVVILGGPGIGKTTELEQAATQEADAIFCTVSQFLADHVDLYQGKTIFLDALDEHRAEVHQGQTVINAIRGHLLNLGCPRVRISCRGEEWHQGSDVKSLISVTSGEPVYILKMLLLREEDIRAIALEEIEDVDTFLVGAKERQLEEALENPENLKLYLKVYKSTGSWPRTRAELMERSTELLISEENEQHERARGARISDERLMQAAEDLSAILLFGDKEGAALSRPAGSNLYIPLQELRCIDFDAFDLMARRRLFSSDAPERVHPQHKTTGDYLAAKALVRRIQDKSLPLGRALSLVTGKDGGPLSHLRDVYAWLIALLPEHAERLIKADPFGALIYGDVGQWSVATRRTALKHLSAYAANNDPWFRAGSWHAPLLGGLACPELVDDFRDILKHETSPHVTSVVLGALELGNPLPELGDDLLSFIRDPGRPQHDWLRDDALRSFIRMCPDRIEHRKALLGEIEAGVVPDDDNLLRGVLLCDLYPVAVGPGEVVHYLAAANFASIGSMDRFVCLDLMEKTPESELPVLADSVLANPDDVKELHEFDRRKLNGKLVSKLLKVYGSAPAAGKIYTWLGIYMDKYQHPHLDREDTDFIRTYFETHPEFYVNLFRHWLDQATPHEKDGYGFPVNDFRSRTLYASPPRLFPENLLNWAIETKDPEKARFLFELAVDTIACGDPAAFGVSFDDLFDFVDANPVFAKIWERKRTRCVPDWRWQSARNNMESRQKKNAERVKNIEVLSPRLEALRTGIDLRYLHWGALFWFGLHISAETEKEPLERIQQQTNDTIARAFTCGFQKLLKQDFPKSPSEIVKNYRRGKMYFECRPLLAGADIVAARSMEEFLTLPKENVKTALTYHMLYGRENETTTWENHVWSVLPDIAQEALGEIWRAELAGGKKDQLTEAYVGRAEDLSTPIVLSEILVLLKENPALPPQILESFLKAILEHGDAEVLQPLAPIALGNNRVRGEKRTLWLAVAALFSPEEYAHKLDRRLGTSSFGARTALGIFTAGGDTCLNGLKSIPHLYMAISILGRYFKNVQMPIGEHSGVEHELWDAARSIRGLIDTLAGLATEEASRAFEKLIADPALHEWRDHLRHSQTIQASNLRDAQFAPPTAQDVCTLLVGGAPANLTDFQALVVDIVDDMAAEIRGGNANVWKDFWTHAGRGKLDKPKIENDSRDVILRWIRPYLSSRDITSEPEGTAADLKQVDMRLTCAKTGTMPIEIKRDENAELWTAMKDQLLGRYTNDPLTGGYGIYLVLWHGKDGNGCKSPPKELDIDTPQTPTELHAALEEIKPDSRFVVRVLDVSKPHN